MLQNELVPVPEPARSRRAFTDRYLAALKPAPKRYDVLDPARKGLLLRVMPTGTKTFFFRYQRHGRVERLLIGRYPATSLRAAYLAHGELTRRLHLGEDLRSAVASVAAASPGAGQLAPSGPTVGDLAEEFLRRYVHRERKRPEAAEQAIKANILKPWRHRQAKSITRRDGVLLLDKIVDRGSPVMANRVAALLAQMFTFGVDRGMLDATPFISMPRPGGTENSRKRKLSEPEVRRFWRRLTRTRLSFEVRTALKLILVTAQRPGEVALAAREEFDLERRVWAIPPERSKNGQPHEVPLNDLAILLLKRLRRHFGETQYILPSRCWRVRGAAAITVRALSQGVRDNDACFGLARFTPHDLRRTAASLMTASGVPRLHVEKVLNHTIDDVAEIYDRHDYAHEKRVALDKLDAMLWNTLRRAKCPVTAFPVLERMVGAA
jgi:integrase